MVTLLEAVSTRDLAGGILGLSGLAWSLYLKQLVPEIYLVVSLVCQGWHGLST